MRRKDDLKFLFSISDFAFALVLSHHIGFCVWFLSVFRSLYLAETGFKVSLVSDLGSRVFSRSVKCKQLSQCQIFFLLQNSRPFMETQMWAQKLRSYFFFTQFLIHETKSVSSVPIRICCLFNPGCH